MFHELETAGIGRVEANYSGSGDDGEINDTSFYKQDGSPAGAERVLEAQTLDWLHELMYDNGVGFDNEGSAGNATVHVKERKVVFDHGWYSDELVPDPFELVFVAGPVVGEYEHRAIAKPPQPLDTLSEILRRAKEYADAGRDFPVSGAGGLIDLIGTANSAESKVA